jgi:hypothetical protein
MLKAYELFNIFFMDIHFFASNLIFYFRQDGRQKSEDRCTGHFSFLPRNLLNYQFTGIIAYMHLFFYYNLIIQPRLSSTFPYLILSKVSRTWMENESGDLGAKS